MLNHFEELLEVFMVVSTIFFICLICCGEDSIKSIHTYASLEA